MGKKKKEVVKKKKVFFKKGAKKAVSAIKKYQYKVPANSMALATVSYNDIAKPDMFESKNKQGQSLHLLKSHFPQKVIDFINMPTPAKYIFEREGAGGKKFKYIPGWYAKKCANYAFGFNQSFEIKSHTIVGVSALVEGRFLVNDPKTGKEILHKDDIGGHIIRFAKDKARTPENAVDIANDYKSAVTDCMKRCMSQIGFWKDVYGVNEAKDEGVRVKDEAPRETVVAVKNEKVVEQTMEDAILCSRCDGIMTQAESDFSMRLYKKNICRECQAELKGKK